MDVFTDSAAPADETVSSNEPVTREKRYDNWRGRIAKCRRLRRQLIIDWALNIDYRRGKQFETDSDQDRVQIMVDWAATKAKQSQLFSQVPEVRLTPKHKSYAGAIPTFGKKVNETLALARVGVAMDEVMPDVINAAGFGGVLVAYESRTVQKSIPEPTSEAAAALQAAGQEVPMTTIPDVASSRFTIQRISPADLLWPVDFTGSDFNDAPWLGHSGRMPWSVALHEFGKSEKNPHGLSSDDKKAVSGTDERSTYDMLTHAGEPERYRDGEQVSYDEIFYWNYRQDPEETSFEAIHRLVFVNGKTEPVIDEPWEGQRRTDQGLIVGSCKFPLQFLTLTYISDEAIPPSDSAAGRPQVDELIRSRSQMVRNREHSMPLRWFNPDRVPVEVQTTLMRGTWQGMVPISGDGNRAIGEVARASYPSEDFEFDRIAKTDLAETWQVSGAQLGTAGNVAVRSASEAQITQANFATRIGYERARVVRFFVNIAEVVAGLVALYGQFTDEETQALASWDRLQLPGYYTYQVRADATVLLDAQQRAQRLENFLNITAKSGVVDVLPVIQEMASLAGVSEEIVHPPQSGGPDPANVSIRISGADDLNNPILVAMLMKTGQMPNPQELEQAKLLIMTSLQPINPGGLPAGQGGPVPAGVPAAPVGQPQPPGGLEANPEWDEASRINKRSEDGR